MNEGVRRICVVIRGIGVLAIFGGFIGGMSSYEYTKSLWDVLKAVAAGTMVCGIFYVIAWVVEGFAIRKSQ